jgi:hypothetical protein
MIPYGEEDRRFHRELQMTQEQLWGSSQFWQPQLPQTGHQYSLMIKPGITIER